MRLLIVGSLGGELGTASRIAMSRGAKVGQADDTNAALASLRAGQGADLLMVDIRFDIAKLVADLASERISVPVVACGIDADSEAAVRAIKAGAREFIPLPPEAELIAAVLEAVAEESNSFIYDDPAIARVLDLAKQVAGSEANILITGPSGTGKELAARAIGQSRYIPFEPGRRRFTEDVAGSFYALNLSALSPTLIESELFGHRRGAFTGAVADRTGWLEACPRLGTVFLDEIGDLDPGIQLKLLRVLQTRTFQRTGDTMDLHFHGKIIAATNRDPLAEREPGRFRDDFYYRLCSDTLVAPSLHERLLDSRDELGHLLQHIARLLIDADADALADEVERYIDRHLARDYPWPGNVRELEQCVRNVLVRKEYRPPRRTATSGREHLAEAVCCASLTADELLCRYCTLVYSQCGSFQEAARRLGLDRRTVKSRIDAKLLLAFRRGT